MEAVVGEMRNECAHLERTKVGGGYLKKIPGFDYEDVYSPDILQYMSGLLWHLQQDRHFELCTLNHRKG